MILRLTIVTGSDTETLTVTEKSSLYYICGYIAFKEEIVCEDDAEKVDLPNEAEFTLNVPRGRLKLPPINLYEFSQFVFQIAKKTSVAQKYFLKGAFTKDVRPKS